MNVSIADLKNIAISGAGMILDAKTISAGDLKTIATYASNTKTQSSITIKSSYALSSGDLQAIAICSKGRVIFDFCNA